MSHPRVSRPGPSLLVTVLAVLALTASAAGLPRTAPRAAAAPAAATSAPCRGTQEVGGDLPDGPDRHPLIAALGLPQAWDLSTGDGVTVAVIDSGVDARHPDIDANVVRGREFTTVYDETGYRKSAPKWQHDCPGHGTGVAGIIAAERTDRMAGVAPGATLYPVRIAEDQVGEAQDRMIAAAIDDAVQHGTQVINLSLSDPNDREPIRQAVARAVAADIVVVAAAGNEGDAGVGGGRTYPAAYPGVLAVGAVDASGRPLDSSHTGDWIDLAGFGADIVLVAPGGRGYRVDSGTSFAAPQVSGTAALVRSLFPDLTAPEVAERLTSSATPLGGGRNDATGAGLVDPFRALAQLGTSRGEHPDEEADEDDGAAFDSRVPVRSPPAPEPLLSSTEATALAVSGVLLLTVLLGLLATPGLYRAARRGWRPGDLGTARPAPGPTSRPRAPDPPAASLAWLGTSAGADPGPGASHHDQTAHSTRDRTR